MDDARIEAIIHAAHFLYSNNSSSAKKVITEEYPFIPIKSEGRNYTTKEMMWQFFRDGFIDRYSGDRLVNPGLLRVISQMLPDVFPYHSHWKTDECHIAYWHYQPTIDHIHPISLGGIDDPENWATTSMINNSAKSSFTLEQLGWSLKDRGNICDWDGLSRVFIDIVEQNDDLLRINRIKEYYKVTKELFQEFKM